jgi:hypothetical protein
MSKVSATYTDRNPEPNQRTIGGGFAYNETVSVEPTNVELVSPIKVGQSKALGAVMLFPKTASRPAKRYWIDIDDLYAKYQDKAELFAKFLDTKTKTFVGACKLGINKGEVFLVAA